ncbi:MAG: hypothetical protein HC806_07625 [Anaerolineae bacterium]|nr:hypothetical protein [Anaerolineae bacterium]
MKFPGGIGVPWGVGEAVFVGPGKVDTMVGDGVLVFEAVGVGVTLIVVYR